MAKKVLITGMSGLIGGLVRNRLEGKYELSALNRSNLSGITCHRADISDLEMIRPAFDGIDVVVHMAAVVRGNASWEEILPNNVVGTYNVFEAARSAGVKRVVFASSGAAVSGWEHEMPYQALVEGRYEEVGEKWEKLTHETPCRPSGLYGCSKVWGEALARHFSDTFGLSVLCLRIGSVSTEDRPKLGSSSSNQPQQMRQFSVWCSQNTIGRMVEACVEAPEALKFDVFFVVSNNKWSYRDMDHARDVLGFEPDGSAEDWR